MGSEGGLTYKLGDIIKALANIQRCEQEGALANVGISEFEQLLQVLTVALCAWMFVLTRNSSMLQHTWTTTLLEFPKHSRSRDVQ